MATRSRISKPDDVNVIAGSIRRAIDGLPVQPYLRTSMVAKLQEMFDVNAIYEIAAIQTINATEFRAALVVLATIASENESILRKWSKAHEDLAALFKEELFERSAELGKLLRRASERGRKAVNARHDQPGGYRDLKLNVLRLWESGKFKTKTACAMAAQKKFGITHGVALKYLRTPRKKRASTS